MTTNRGLRRDLLVMLLLGFVVVTLYWPAVTDEFLLLDDNTHVVKNPYVRAGTLDGLWRFFRAPYEGLYVPLSYSAWWLAAKISSMFGGFGAASFHAINILLHAANGWLVFLVIRQILPQSWKGAAVGALFFVVHPIQVEAVAWVSGMRDLLCAAFMLSSMLAFCWFLKRVRGIEKYSWCNGYYLAGLSLFILALLSKPHAVALPMFLAVLAVSFGWLTAKRAAIYLLPWCAAIIPIVYLTWSAQNSSSLEIGAPLLSRPAVAIDALAFYIGKILWPFGLLIDYGRSVEAFFNERTYLTTIPAFAAMIATAILCRRKLPVLPYLLLFVCGLLPVLGLVPFFHQEISTVANRYVYFSMASISLLIAVLTWQFARIERAIFVAAGVVLLGAACLTSQNLRYWHDNQTFFTRTLEINPKSQVAHAVLGAKYRAEKRYSEAIDHLRASLRTNPRQPKVLNNLGLVLYEQGAVVAAVEMFLNAVHIDPGYADPYINLGRHFLDQGRPERAVLELNRALQINPGAFEVHNNLGIAYYRLGMRDRAIASFRIASQINPEAVEVKRNLRVLTNM